MCSVENIVLQWMVSKSIRAKMLSLLMIITKLVHDFHDIPKLSVKKVGNSLSAGTIFPR